MFTLQNKLLQNAAESGEPQDMVQAVGNCAAPLKHRGPIASTHVPNINFRGGDYPPENGDIIFDIGPTINIPPWENVPFYPTPPLDVPQFFPYEYPPQWDDGQPYPFPDTEPSVSVDGPARVGDLVTNNITTVDQTFHGDIFYEGERLSFTRTQLVTDIYWDSTAKALKATKARALIVANVGRQVTNTVVAGVECAIE